MEGFITGDDAFAFMEAFGARFHVDLSSYLWYFHHAEEGMNFGAAFFPSPDQRVPHIAVTPNLLTKAIAAKRWPVVYPPHQLPKVRWDLRVNLGCFLVSLAAAAVWALFEYTPL